MPILRQKVRGLETYYLNLTTNAEAMRVAARENATSTHQMSDLAGYSLRYHEKLQD